MMIITKEECTVIKDQDKIYLCVFSGINRDEYGQYYINFVINGKRKSMVATGDDLIELADTAFNDTDLASDLLDSQIKQDTAEYVIDWGLLD